MCLVSIAYWRRGTLVRLYSHWVTIRCASPIFKPIAYKLSCTNRKRKYFEEKTTATLKIKQTSIATVRNHLRTLASFPTPLIFHWSLPLCNAAAHWSVPHIFCQKTGADRLGRDQSSFRPSALYSIWPIILKY